jgi:hypothetical protein
LASKGCHQSLGLLQGKDFLHFIYDVFLGIRFHHKPAPTLNPIADHSSTVIGGSSCGEEEGSKEEAISTISAR